MPTSTIVPALSALLFVSIVSQGAALVSSAVAERPADDSQEAAPNFTELDLWQEELDQKSREVAVKAENAALVLAEAERKAEQAKMTRVRLTTTADVAKKLATVYGAMEPQKAADTLASLSTDKSAAVIAEMAPDVAGPIISAMPKSQRHDIAAYLLEPN